MRILRLELHFCRKRGITDSGDVYFCRRSRARDESWALGEDLGASLVNVYCDARSVDPRKVLLWANLERCMKAFKWSGFNGIYENNQSAWQKYMYMSAPIKVRQEREFWCNITQTFDNKDFRNDVKIIKVFLQSDHSTYIFLNDNGETFTLQLCLFSRKWRHIESSTAK